MKTKRLSIVVLLLLFVQQTQAQVKGNAEYLIRYDVEFVLDSTNREAITREVHRLYTGSATSQYISEVSVKRDSVFSILMESTGSRGMRGGFQNILPRAEFHSVVFKDLINSQVWVRNQISRDTYQYQEPNTPLQWEFTEDTKQIGQYSVIKATTSFGGRDYEAWFTLEVPILDGPYVFSGLPGLILELYDTQKDYQFFLNSLVPLKEKHQVNSEEGNIKKMKKADFVKFYVRNRENPVSPMAGRISGQFRDRDGRTITAADIERRMKEEASKRNNQIEKW